MPAFEKDGLEPDRCHGDVMLSICADHRDTVVHTMRELLRTTAGVLTPRWRIDGFQTAKRGPTPRSSTRNLFGFRDGTSNPDPTDAKLMDQLVWVEPGAGETALDRGRHLPGGPHDPHARRVLGPGRDVRADEHDRPGPGHRRAARRHRRVREPALRPRPARQADPPSAHIRLANPRTPATEDQRILRRPYNYDRGLDEAGNLDQGSSSSPSTRTSPASSRPSRSASRKRKWPTTSPRSGAATTSPPRRRRLRRLGRLRHVRLSARGNAVADRPRREQCRRATRGRLDGGEGLFDVGAVDVEVGDGADAAFEEAHFDAGRRRACRGGAGRRGRRR